MSWHRGASARKINAYEVNSNISALQLLDETPVDLAAYKEDSTPNEVSLSQNEILISKKQSKVPTQPEITTQLWLKTHHPDHRPVKLLPPSKKEPPPSPANKPASPDATTSPDADSAEAEADQLEIATVNTLGDVRGPLNLDVDLQNMYAQKMMTSLLQYDEKQLKQMLIMGVLSPVEVCKTYGIFSWLVEHAALRTGNIGWHLIIKYPTCHSQEAFLLGRMGWTKDMQLPPEEMRSFRPRVCGID